MTKVIGIVNQKGGVSKTSTATALWTGLSFHHGLKTLAIDLDPQCNLTISSGATMDGETVLDALMERCSAKDAIQHTELGDLIAAHKGLGGIEALLTKVGREYRLRETIKPLIEGNIYDFIILDTPPSMGILTINALTACTSTIIPAFADFFSMYGISQLAETIDSVKQYTNPNIRIDGILLTRYTDRTILNRDMAENIKQLAERLKTKVFKTTIREAVNVREAQLSQKSIFTFAPKAKVTQDYANFIIELLEGEKS